MNDHSSCELLVVEIACRASQSGASDMVELPMS